MKIKSNLIAEWDFNANGPAECKSRDSVWWICSKNKEHRWKALLSNRNKGTGCPFCIGRKVNNTNSLLKHKNLLDEWSTKNKKDPKDFYELSSKYVWWKCNKKHEWKASISSRVSGSGCPYCDGKLASNERSLKVLFPEISKEWSNKNDCLSSDVLPFSKKKAWWKCIKCQKDWQATICDRTLSGSGCHYCSGYILQKKALYNDDRSEKRCNSCFEWRKIEEYRIKSSKGKWLNNICKECEQKKVLQYRTMTKKGVVAEIIRRKKYECKKKNILYDLDSEFLLKRLEDIDWKCEVTGIPMMAMRSSLDEKRKGFNLDSISLDRINPDGGYVKDNVRFVLNQVNTFKLNGTDSRMLKIAEAIVKNKNKLKL